MMACLLSQLVVLSLLFPTPLAGFALHGKKRTIELYATPNDDDDAYLDLPPSPRKRKTDLQKTDLYSTDELQNLLGLHSNLVESEPGFLGNDRPSETSKDTAVFDATEDSLLSLHELVVASTSESISTQNDPGQSPRIQFDSSLGSEELRTAVAGIKAIASDVDGTLLSASHTLHSTTRKAIEEAVEATFSPIHPLQTFFLATGKTRKGALRSLGMEQLLGQLPGVFIQGLYCVDATGTVVYEQKLPRLVVEAAENLAATHEVSVFGYDGDALWATTWSDSKLIDDVETKYGEPRPTVVDESLAAHEPSFHKLLYMNDDTEWLTNTLRPQLESLAAELDCVVTQAIPNMLELLPPGCSKAVGVQNLCEALGVSLSTDVCAIGDAENDLAMLREAAIGVAVGNAAPNVKEIADIVIHKTNGEGGAGEAIKLFGLGEVKGCLGLEQSKPNPLYLE